jgi:hypothetical protein
LDQDIGAGGMSVVWRAHDELLGRSVAVKVLSGEQRACACDTIRAEAQAAAGLHHPNVTNVYDYGESVGEDGTREPYVVMELLSGVSLADRLESGPLPPDTALRVCAEVAAALAAAHTCNVVHRDVKPGNIMLTPTGVKVFDFGIAAPVGEPDAADPAGMILGTPAYLAPERLLGGTVMPETDVYSLGLLLYRLLTGEQPRPPNDAFAGPAPLPAMEGVPTEVVDLYAACVETIPRRRPSAGEAAEVLAAAAGIPLPGAIVAGPGVGSSAGVHGTALAGSAGLSAFPSAAASQASGHMEQTEAMSSPLRRRAVHALGLVAAACAAVLLLFVIVDRTPRPASGPHADTVVPAETFGDAGRGAEPRPPDPSSDGDTVVEAICGGSSTDQGFDRDRDHGRGSRGKGRGGDNKSSCYGGQSISRQGSAGDDQRLVIHRATS